MEGRGRANRDWVQRCGERCSQQRLATVDPDATLIESRKREALPTDEGPRGYQPMLAVGAETGLVRADPFRDGSLPAQMAPLEVAQRAFAALPGTVKEFYYRGDSACHESGLVNWLRNEQREGGPQGKIGFAHSRRMSEALHAAIYPGGGNPAHALHSGPLRLSRLGYQPPAYPPAGVWHFYDRRAVMETRIRELREDFALRKIPTASWTAHAIFLEIIRLAANLVSRRSNLGVKPK